jgi:hypothetical protein
MMVEQDMRFVYILMNADWGLCGSPMALNQYVLPYDRKKKQ